MLICAEKVPFSDWWTVFVIIEVMHFLLIQFDALFSVLCISTLRATELNKSRGKHFIRCSRSVSLSSICMQMLKK